MVSNTKGKNSKNIQKEILCNLYRSIIVLRPDQLLFTFYLCIGKLAPDHLGVETGLGSEALIKAVATSIGQSRVNVRKQEKQVGDLGMVAANGKAS
mmetsp:Transcript_21773/g.3606  ORF Transcript_21773/g.3606 Transcript_21773/m.3606 type:complete len:96 (+) Transcript_21773:284-571(+)